MIPEIITVGGAMTIAIFLVWAMMVLVANKAAEIRGKKALVATA